MTTVRTEKKKHTELYSTDKFLEVAALLAARYKLRRVEIDGDGKCTFFFQSDSRLHLFLTALKQQAVAIPPRHYLTAFTAVRGFSRVIRATYFEPSKQGGEQEQDDGDERR